MPELPEVETVARGLRDPLVGRKIVGVAVHWPRTIACPTEEEFRVLIVGRRATSVGRRGKYLIIGLHEGALLIHLKMSGRLGVVPASCPPDKHVHMVLDLDDGNQLRFRDVRKFGRVYLVDDPMQVTSQLGPEPLADDFRLEDFRRLLNRRSGRLKTLLLNQQFLAGLGNIYADEALFVAGLHPLRKADSLTPEEQASLYTAIRTVLSRAIDHGGTTLDDQGYTDAQGRAGAYQERINVYGRKEKPCPRCGTPVERIVLGGRSTHFCSRCQK
jgi:formamidopyrimidine-DNA glycosylase